MGSILLRGARAAALISLLVAPAANAQQYEDEVGDLNLEVAVSITVTIAGEGYVPASVAYVTLTTADGETEYDLGTVQIDDEGRFFAEITLPKDLGDGGYTVAATGVTATGATLVLSARFGVGGELTLQPDEPASTTSSTEAIDVTESTLADEPVETTGTTRPDPSSGDRSAPPVIFLGLGVAGGLALGGAWWWIYRVIRK